MEYTSRLDFLWKTKFKSEREEVETMGDVNKILLENILPAHVALHFLSSNRRTDVSKILKMLILFYKHAIFTARWRSRIIAKSDFISGEKANTIMNEY